MLEIFIYLSIINATEIYIPCQFDPIYWIICQFQFFLIHTTPAQMIFF